MRRWLLILCLVLLPSLAFGAGGHNYPGGLTTLSAAGCVSWVPDVDLNTPGVQGPARWESTGSPCGTANALATCTYSSLAAQANGTTCYCTNCTEATPCASGGSGAVAQKINGTWKCASAGGGGTECSTTQCSLHVDTTINGVGICDANGNNCPAASSSAFSAITNGTNTTANAMVVGSGASLSFSGTGTLNASAVEGTDLGTLTNTRLCTYDSANTEIDCDTLETDPKVGSVTSGNFCKGTGTQVSCTDSSTYDSSTTNELPVEGTYIDVSGQTVSFDPREIGVGTSEVTWGEVADAPVTWIWDVGAVDATLRFDENSVSVSNQPDDGQMVFSVDGQTITDSLNTPFATVTSQAILDTSAVVVFEGSSADAFETTLTVANPTTSDKTITLPNASGTVPLLESDNVFTGTMDVVPGSATRLQVNPLGVSITDYSVSKGVLLDNSTGVLAKLGTGRIDADNLNGTNFNTMTNGKACVYASAGTEVNCNSTFLTAESQNIFQTMSTPAGTSPVADSPTDTLTYTAGTGVTITGDSTTDTIDIAVADTSATNELPLAGSYIDISGSPLSTVSFDPTELMDNNSPVPGTMTISDGSQSTLDITYATTAANDLKMAIVDGNVTWWNATVGSRADTPAFNLVDTSPSKTAGQLSASCTDTSNCAVTITYEDSGLKTLLTADGATSTATIGSASLDALTVTTNGTGNGEVVLPTGSIGSGEILDGTVAIADLSATGTPGATNFLRGDNTWATPATIPAAFALNVDKSGTDSSSCGPINAPCATITGANGAFAKIRTNNDNGFATCSLDNSVGCGRCSVTTSTQCNENADCPGGETCTATNSVCSGLSKGTCTGPAKFYQVNVAAGEYNEYMARICVGGSDDGEACNESGVTCSGGTCTDNSPPSPGYIFLNFTPRTIAYHGADCLLEYTNRTFVTFNGNGEQPGGGGALISWSGHAASAAWCSYGGGHGNAINGATLAHLGPGWDWRQIGTDNATNGIHNSIMGGIGSGASANGAYIESYPATCSGDATRGCIVDGDCAGGQTCTVDGSSDWSISNSFLQYGDAKAGTVINVVAKGCGSAFNQFLQGLTAHIGGGASYCVGGTNDGALCTVASECPSGGTCTNQAVTFLKTERSSCHASSNAIVAATGLDVIVKDVKIRGLESGVSGFTQPDVTANIGANTTMESNGAQSWDHCKRTIGGTLVYASSDQKYAGGMTELGPLACTAPPNPVNGECWYDLTTNTRKCQRNSATLTAAFTRTHATDCTNNITDGKKGDLCTDEDDGRTWVCIPTSGDCNTTAEWLPVGKQSTMAEDISADTASFAAATTDYTMASLAQWTNSTGGTLLLFAGDFVTGGAGAKTFTCHMRNNGTTITGSTFSATADNNSPAHAIVSYSVFTQATINGTVDVRCQVDSGTTATVSAVSFRRITFDAPLIAYGSGVPAWLATPSSANLATAVTDETGSGAVVFGTAPTITTPTLTLENGSSPPTAANRIYKDTTKKRVTIADGTTANPIGLFFPETGIGYNTFTTTKTYQTAFGSPGGSLACFTTESTRQGMVAGNITCDALSVCGDLALAASEKVTITLRVDTNADGTGADTTLTCDVDGDAASSNCDGTSTKKGCRVTLSTPVEIAKDTLVSYGAVCAGAGCPTGNENFQAQLRCWPTQ